MLNIYPYNYYSLYGALILLGLVLVITLFKALKMSKNLKVMSAQTANIQNNLSIMQNKSNIAKEIKEEKKKKNAWIKTVLPIAWAIRTIYKKNDDLVGLKGYKTAATTYLKTSQAEKKIIKRVNRALLKK